MFKRKKQSKDNAVETTEKAIIVGDETDMLYIKNKEFYGNVSKYDFVDESIFESNLDLEKTEE